MKQFWNLISKGLPDKGHDRLGYLEVIVKTIDGDNIICCHKRGADHFSWIEEPSYERLFDIEINNLTHYAVLPEVEK